MTQPPQVFLDHMAEIVRRLEECPTDCQYYLVRTHGDQYMFAQVTRDLVQRGVEVSDPSGRLAEIWKQPLLPGRVRFVARIEVEGVVMYGTGDTHDGCWFYAERQPAVGELS